MVVLQGMEPEPTNAASIGLALHDGDPIQAQRLAELIGRAPGIRILGVFSSAEAVIGAASHLRPQVLLMDIGDGAGNLLSGVLRVRSAHPWLLILVRGTVEKIEVVLAALRSGADGYLLHSDALEIVVAGIRKTAMGGTPLSRTVSRSILKFLRSLPPSALPDDKGAHRKYGTITKREAQVLHHLASGATNKEIAHRLRISSETVRAHTRSIFRKLGVNSRTAAAMRFFGVERLRRSAS